LTGDGLIAVAREEVVDSRLRRYYELTDEGARRLQVEVERLQRNAEAATRSLAARFGPGSRRGARAGPDPGPRPA
jgi:DNA-binding PadR family transcriptional regulator